MTTIRVETRYTGTDTEYRFSSPQGMRWRNILKAQATLNKGDECRDLIGRLFVIEKVEPIRDGEINSRDALYVRRVGTEGLFAMMRYDLLPV